MLIGLIVWFFWEKRESRDDYEPGLLNGVHVFITVPSLLIGFIIWLIIFYVAFPT